jgi:hypothetical protein
MCVFSVDFRAGRRSSVGGASSVLIEGGVLSIVLGLAAISAAVRVEDDRQSCLVRDDVRVRLARVLARARRDVSVSAVAKPAEGDPATTVVTLKAVERTGDPLVDRSFILEREDCKSAGALLETVLEQALHELPEPEVEPPSGPAGIGVGVGLGIDGALLPAGGGLALSAETDIGSMRNRFVGSLFFRVARPETLGTGRFYQGMGLAGAGYLHQQESVGVAFEIRGGLVVLAGSGFDKSDTAYLPWIEGVARLLVTLGVVQVGPELCVSPLSEAVAVVGQPDTTQVARFRVGLLLSLPIGRWEI